MIKWKSVSEDALAGDYFANEEEGSTAISVCCDLVEAEGSMVVPNRSYDVVIKVEGENVCVGRVSSSVSIENAEDTNAVADIANYYIDSYFHHKAMTKEEE